MTIHKRRGSGYGGYYLFFAVGGIGIALLVLTALGVIDLPY